MNSSKSLILSCFLLVVSLHYRINAFVVSPNNKMNTLNSMASSSSSSKLDMCICINCARVTNCGAYHFVEERHEQPHMTENPTFEPQDGSPTIHVNIRTIQNDEDRKNEMERMWREHKAETERAMAKQQQDEKDNTNDGGEEEALYGETTYDLSGVTTYEYDIVECEDYVEDTGAWVRNMPQEIRDANPNFVPS